MKDSNKLFKHSEQILNQNKKRKSLTKLVNPTQIETSNSNSNTSVPKDAKSNKPSSNATRNCCQRSKALKARSKYYFQLMGEVNIYDDPKSTNLQDNHWSKYQLSQILLNALPPNLQKHIQILICYFQMLDENRTRIVICKSFSKST